jgi:anti-anti-sigma factor
MGVEEGGEAVTTADAFAAQQTGFTLPRQRPSGEHNIATQPMRLCVRRPRPDTAVVFVRGDVDMLTAPRLTELLVARLRGTLRTLVVDLSEVDFLGAAGLTALLYADLLARHSGITMRVVTGGNHAAMRPLTVTGIDGRLEVDSAG